MAQLSQKVGKKPIYYKSWSFKGIQKVRHLMRDESKCLSFELKERFDIKPNFLAFYGFVLSIKNPKKCGKNAIPLKRKL